MTVLVTGSTGFLGPYLMEAIAGGEKAVGVARSGDADYRCDLTDRFQVAELMANVKPSCIIHAAAMTDVNLCQSNPELAMKVNVLATRNVCQSAPKDCRVIYISSDMVYSGNKVPHKEYSISESPLNQYGLSKYLGEVEVIQKARDYLVLRTNIFGFAKTPRQSSLIDWLAGQFKSSEPVNLFNDVLFSPLWVGTLARMVAECSQKNRTGVFNLGSTSGTSKLQFSLHVASVLKLPVTLARSVASASMPSRVPRPLDTRMDISRAESMLGLMMPPLETDILNMLRGKYEQNSKPNSEGATAVRH